VDGIAQNLAGQLNRLSLGGVEVDKLRTFLISPRGSVQNMKMEAGHCGLRLGMEHCVSQSAVAFMVLMMANNPDQMPFLIQVDRPTSTWV
jgi:hypothetical protein